jgi:hypothetical protein
MPLKTSDLYSSIWASCDELRGGMDASQYKDYVLFMLFIKHITDKYGNSDDFAPPVTIPKGASFTDMIALKGNRSKRRSARAFTTDSSSLTSRASTSLFCITSWPVSNQLGRLAGRLVRR